MHVMDMVLKSKELFFKLTAATLCGIANEKYHINFLKQFMNV